MSGRGAGFCGGHDAPGFAYPGHRMRGMRRAWRGRGWFGWHGMPMHHHGPYRGWSPMDFVAYEVPHPAEMSAEERADLLSTREAWLQEQLEEVRNELEELKTAEANPADEPGKKSKKTDD